MESRWCVTAVTVRPSLLREESWYYKIVLTLGSDKIKLGVVFRV